MKFLLFCLCFSAVFLSGREITIVKNRKPYAEIVTGAKPTRAVQFAAYELQHVVRLMTGATLPIVRTPSGKMLPFILGGAKKGEFKREAYSVSVKPDKIVLKGNDSQDFGKVNYKNQRTYPAPEYNYHSTLYAVYDFLEYCAGVRFYAPGDLGIGMKKRPNLIVKPFERKYTPAEQGLRFVYYNRDRQYQLRLRCNKLYGYKNHSAFSLGFRYWGKARRYENAFVEKRAEYFASGWEKPYYDANVNHLFDPKDPLPAQICLSHPDVLRHFADENIAMFKGKPQPGTRFVIPKMEDCPYFAGFSEQDNDHWCQCKKCSAKFPQVEPEFRYNYRHFEFVNKLAREMKKYSPELRLVSNAYNKYLRYPDPKILKLDPGIAISMCLNRDQWPARGKFYQWQIKAYRDWVKHESKNRYLFTWEHFLSPPVRAKKVFKYKYFPYYYPKDTAAFYKQHVKDGLHGAFLEINPVLNPLETYLIMRTIWDPDYNTEKVLREYYELMYAEAAKPMSDFFSEIEKIITDPKNYPKTHAHVHSQEVNWALGTHERMKKLDGYIRKAYALVKDPDAKKRLDAFCNNVWKQTLQGRKDYDARLSIQKNPQPHISVAYIGKTTVPSQKDWYTTSGSGLWWNSLKGKMYSKEDSPVVKLIFNDKNLFVYYSEKSPLAHRYRQKEMWFNGLEIFCSKDASYPYNQLVIGCNGETFSCEYRDIDGHLERNRNVVPITVLKNEVKPDGWNLILSLPLNGLGITPGKIFRANFLRTRKEWKGKEMISRNAAWSYVVPNTGYADNLFRMGFLHVPPAGERKNVSFDAGFKKILKSGLPYRWFQQTPAVKTAGLLIKAANGKAQINAKSHKVQFIGHTGIPTRNGDKATVNFSVSGKGEIRVTLSAYARGEKISHLIFKGRKSSSILSVSSAKEKKNIILPLDFGIRGRDIQLSLISFTAEKGSDITLSDISVDVHSGK